MIEIRPLNVGDAEPYWNLRLEALDREPLAFGTAVEEHLADGFEAVTKRHLRDDPQGSFMLGAFQGNPSVSPQGGAVDPHSLSAGDGEGLGVGKAEPSNLVGIVGFIRSDRVKQRHSGGVVAMYVAPGFRERGVAHRLMSALILRARGYEGLERLTLDVWIEATAARRLYASLGFVVFGLDRHALKVNEEYADLELMSLDLRRESA